MPASRACRRHGPEGLYVVLRVFTCSASLYVPAAAGCVLGTFLKVHFFLKSPPPFRPPRLICPDLRMEPRDLLVKQRLFLPHRFHMIFQSLILIRHQIDHHRRRNNRCKNGPIHTRALQKRSAYNAHPRLPRLPLFDHARPNVFIQRLPHHLLRRPRIEFREPHVLLVPRDPWLAFEAHECNG